jgi:pimeloyl-ACP methyl ester carboxylesterase
MNLYSNVPLMRRDVSGSGEPLVLVPGGLTGWLSWIPHAERLATSWSVIRLQLHNVAFGLSDDPLPPTYSIDFVVTSLGKTLDGMGIQQADFAGWSYGAEVTLSYAIHHPNRIRSLALIEPPAFWVLRSRGSFSQEVVDGQKFHRTLATDDVTEEQLVRFSHFAGFVPEDINPRSLPQWDVWSKHRQSLRFGDTPFQHEDNIELVRGFEKPVLLIKGEGSSTYYHDIIDIL